MNSRLFKSLWRTFQIALFSFFLAVPLYSIAQEDENTARREFRQAINMCPGGIAFGIYAVNYEYMFKPHHGIVARFDYEAIPKSYTDAKIESSGMAFILNYRWHRAGEMRSEYLGAFARYRRYDGDGTVEGTNFEFTIPEMTVGLNVGKRWAWNSGFNANVAFGYGFIDIGREVDPDSAQIQIRLDDFEEAYDFFDAFLGEVSVGYAF